MVTLELFCVHFSYCGHYITMLHLIGNELPCCISMDIWSYSIRSAGSTTGTWINSYSIPGPYTVSNVTVTKDGYHYQPKGLYYSYRIRYIRINFEVLPHDTGVYGYHLMMSSSTSSSTLLRNLTVSFYVPLVVQGNGI